MNTITHSFAEWRADESGVTAIEYALMGSLIAVAILGAVGATGASLLTLYTNVSVAVATAL
ncbi:Flp family type IVb pilin [Rhodoferax ferrireducens]|uniref:Flp family type IVb pilin n=1 Tax=Rhodoferax ferrireducens TaxID=192843 RepID=UPI00298E9F6F|nr:Flp family type IVb pilin [Rhodoferax ferrireducens]WPC67757.1 Flp family type IVb pilin [Rhodoferax ferrireducens]